MTSHAAAIDRQRLADALLHCGPWKCCDDDQALIDHAEAQADHVDRIRWRAGESDAYLAGERRVLAHGLTLPDETLRGQLARLCCPVWWRRQLRRLNARRLEQRQRILGQVHDRAGIYVSQQGYARRRAQHTRNARLLEAVTATNDQGQEYTLAELAELGLANPNNRRAELMLRIADTEREAIRLGHVGLFLTVTCPSRFHAVHHGTARHNRKWLEGGTADPREAQAYLQGVWSKARAFLGRRNLGSYGIRVVEPHHDGTPHWHLLLWCEPQNVGAVLGALRAYAVDEDWHEIAPRPKDTPSQALEREVKRFDAKIIDSARGTAAGYVAKYVSKNINGEQFNRLGVANDHLDQYGHSLTSAAPRIEAWASCWGIRQFQFVGLPSVTVWRELRRLRQAELLAQWMVERDPSESAVELMQRLHAAADGGEWAEFLRLMGGPMTRRDEQPARPWRIERRAVGGVQLGAYGEPVEAPLGIVVQGFECLTRHYLWTTERTGRAAASIDTNAAAPRPIGRAFDPDQGREIARAVPATMIGLGRLSPLTLRAGGAPWTRVNNSTRPLGADLFERIREDRAREKLRGKRRFRGREYGPMPRIPRRKADTIREATAVEVAAYRAESDRRRLIAAHERQQGAADRQRLEQGRQAIAGALLAGTLTPDDLTPDTIEVLTA